MPQRVCGFTLYELLLSLLLLAMLALAGLPSFAEMSANSRLRTETGALFHAMNLARQESVLRRRVVSVCPRSERQDCRPGFDWSDGWLVFANHDRDEPPQIDPGETLLQVHRSSPEVRITANRRGFTLRATDKRATNGTLVLCDLAGRVPPRALVVSYNGRPRVALRNSRGERYACAE